MQSQKMLKLNLGCWHRHIPGWVHIDLCDFPHIDYKSSIDDLSMFDNDTVDLIYSSHSLEYFDRNEVGKVLIEWNRVLKKGALLRIAVPDFDALICVYKKTNNLNKILGPLYGAMEITTESDVINLYHKTAYNFDSLKEILGNAGFGSIERYRWQDTIHKDYDDHSQAYYPHMDKKNGILVSLNVECSKL
jgi:predicted SAM-dependent methyltransferase